MNIYVLIEHREVPVFTGGQRQDPIHRPVYASKERGKVYEKFCDLPSEVALGRSHWHEIVTLEVED